jgi:hypothetical protein
VEQTLIITRHTIVQPALIRGLEWYADDVLWLVVLLLVLVLVVETGNEIADDIGVATVKVVGPITGVVVIGVTPLTGPAAKVQVSGQLVTIEHWHDRGIVIFSSPATCPKFGSNMVGSHVPQSEKSPFIVCG